MQSPLYLHSFSAHKEASDQFHKLFLQLSWYDYEQPHGQCHLQSNLDLRYYFFYFLDSNLLDFIKRAWNTDLIWIL